jgi:glycosyltransferase involved in cell wall biosynthesis
MCLFRKNRNEASTGVVLNFYYPEQLRHARGLRQILADWLYRRALLSLLRRGRVGLRVLHSRFKDGLVERLQPKPPLSDRIAVVPHGMDSFEGPRDQTEARRRLGLSLDGSLFLFFGILRKDKRYDIAIRAMQGLSACRLLIVGHPSEVDANALRDLIRQCGCERSVSLEIGFIEDYRLGDYFLAADAVLVTYAKSFVGLSGVLLQACSCGRCVIGGDVGVIGQTIKENGIGLTVEPENSEDLRRAMREFMVLPAEERTRMEQRAQALAQRESWDMVTAQLETFFARLVK